MNCAVRATLIDAHNQLTEAGTPEDLTITTQIVLAEVLNNVVEHAYCDAASAPIDVALWLAEDGVWCETRDRGAAMPDGRLPGGTLPDIDPSDPSSLPEGGFGWAMVHRMTEHLSYRREDDVNALRFLIPTPDIAPAPEAPAPEAPTPDA